MSQMNQQQHPTPIVILFKERNTKTDGSDSYELACQSAGLESHFLPPLKFTSNLSAISRLVTELQDVAALNRLYCFVATSPRGVQAWCQILEQLDQTTTAPQIFTIIKTKPFYVISGASAHYLDQSTIGQKYGLRATFFPDVQDATQLGWKIRDAWTRARSSDAHEINPVSRITALVGDTRRQELFDVLGGRVKQSESDTNDYWPIDVQEEIVYHSEAVAITTSTPSTSSATSTSSAPTLLSSTSATTKPSEISSFSDQFFQLIKAIANSSATATSPSFNPNVWSRPIYLVFFSPNGVQSFRSIFELGLGADFPAHLVRFVAIGQTTAEPLQRLIQQYPWASPCIVSTQPNPPSLLTCILDDYRSTQSHTIQFYKYHGTKNDYVLLDGFKTYYSRKQLAIIAQTLCQDRLSSIGSDGLLYVTHGQEISLDSIESFRERNPTLAHIHGRMYMFNTDGTEAEMCGNGLRCVAKFVHDHKCRGVSSLNLLTGAGLKVAHIETRDSFGCAMTISLNLGQPTLAPALRKAEVFGREFITHDVSIGNPHCIILMNTLDELNALDVNKSGRAIHDLPTYAATKGVNVNFAVIDAPSPDPIVSSFTVGSSAKMANSSPIFENCSSSSTLASPHRPPPVLTIHLRTYERGNGETYSCGTGMSACVSSILARRTRSPPTSSSTTASDGHYSECVRVFVRGGELFVTCHFQDEPISSSKPANDSTSLLKRVVLSVDLCGPAVESFQGCCRIPNNLLQVL